MVNPKTHLDPIQVTIPFSKKFAYARLQATRKSIAIREKSTNRIPNTAILVLINLFQLLFISLIILGLMFFVILPAIDNDSSNTSNSQNTNQNSTQNNSNSNSNSNSSDSTTSSGTTTDNSNNNNTTTNTDSSSNSSNSDNSSSSSNNVPQQQVTGSLADQVKAALLNSKGVSSFADIKDATDLTSKIKSMTASSNDKVTIRLSISYNETTRAQMRDTAKEIMSAVQSAVPELTTVILCTSDNYYIEPASRSN
jgi:hypothetical protein